MSSPPPGPPALFAVVGELDRHVAEAGWDQPPQLFALVETAELLQAEPQLAAQLGLLAGAGGGLTPVAQDDLGAGPLDERLQRISFGPGVRGVALAHEVLVLPPAAEAALSGSADPVAAAAGHPQRREVRMVVAVVRGGTRECLLRLRGRPGEPDELLSGPDLAPALADALLATLDEGPAAPAPG